MAGDGSLWEELSVSENVISLKTLFHKAGWHHILAGWSSRPSGLPRWVCLQELSSVGLRRAGRQKGRFLLDRMCCVLETWVPAWSCTGVEVLFTCATGQDFNWTCRRGKSKSKEKSQMYRQREFSRIARFTYPLPLYS